MKIFSVILFMLFSSFVLKAQWVPQNSDNNINLWGETSGWTPLSSGTTQTLHSVCFVNENTGFVGGEDLILKTVNGGQSWIQTVIDQTGFWSICFPTETIGYAMAYSKIFKTVDGGENWTNIYNGAGGFVDMFFTDINTGYFTVLNSYELSVLKTTDGCNTWTSQILGNNLYGGNIYFPSNLIGYICVNNHIYKTVDGGDTWQLKSSVIPTSLQAIFFINDDIGFAVGHYEKKDEYSPIYKTINGGTDWTLQNSGTPFWISSVFFTDTNNGFSVCTYGRIINTTNGGDIWTYQSSGTFEHFEEVDFPSENIGYAVGYGGTILKYVNSPIGIDDHLSNAFCLEVYPNPAHNSITLEIITKTQDIQSKLTICSLTGQQFITSQLTELKTTIDVSILPQGVYFLKLEDERTIDVAKFVRK